MGVLRSAAHRRAESRFWGFFIIAVHRAFVLGLGAQHRGIVELSQSVFRCVTVFACYSSSSSGGRGTVITVGAWAWYQGSGGVVYFDMDQLY